MKQLLPGLIGALSAFWIVLAPPPARALCALCSCSVDAPSMSFGAINPLAAAVTDTTGTVTVTCGPIGLLVGYDIRLSTGSSGSYATRTMKDAAKSLSYNLYANAARTQIWGDGSGGSVVVSNGFFIALGGTSRTETIYARAPAAATAQPGAYTDTIIATVVW